MPGLDKRLEWLPERLNSLLEQYGIPAGSIAVWLDGDEYETAAGLANRRARIEATTDTLFLIGSNTKLYTTTLIMQLIDRDALQLDTPVRTVLPDFSLSDDEATEIVTIRHLLSHTSGISGDHFPDFGRGDDAVAKCVASLPDVEMLHRPGEFFSYCNIGFIIAGLVIERLTGLTWDAALQRHLLEPLGSRAFATLPEEALLYRTAVGHTPDPVTGDLAPGQMWPEVRSGGPAGFTPFASARELVLFARLHLDNGNSGRGSQLLSSEHVTTMQRQEVEWTPSGPFDSDGWGLGWARYRYGEEERVVGHNGGSSAVLRVLPDRNFAIASLTNASGGMYVGHHIIDAVVNELFGIRIPADRLPSSRPEDLDRYTGRYRHLDRRRIVSRDGDRLLAHLEGDDSAPVTLEPLDESVFLARSPGIDIPARAAFLQPDNSGKPDYFHIGGRAHRREE